MTDLCVVSSRLFSISSLEVWSISITAPQPLRFDGCRRARVSLQRFLALHFNWSTVLPPGGGGSMKLLSSSTSSVSALSAIFFCGESLNFLVAGSSSGAGCPSRDDTRVVVSEAFSASSLLGAEALASSWPRSVFLDPATMSAVSVANTREPTRLGVSTLKAQTRISGWIWTTKSSGVFHPWLHTYICIYPFKDLCEEVKTVFWTAMFEGDDDGWEGPCFMSDG